MILQITSIWKRNKRIGEHSFFAQIYSKQKLKDIGL